MVIFMFQYSMLHRHIAVLMYWQNILLVDNQKQYLCLQLLENTSLLNCNAHHSSLMCQAVISWHFWHSSLQIISSIKCSKLSKLTFSHFFQSYTNTSTTCSICYRLPQQQLNMYHTSCITSSIAVQFLHIPLSTEESPCPESITVSCYVEGGFVRPFVIKHTNYLKIYSSKMYTKRNPVFRMIDPFCVPHSAVDVSIQLIFS